jgi:hypothetical protein
VRLLKALVAFVVGTVAGVVGNDLFGAFGAVFAFIAGGVAAWWVAHKIFD